MPLTNEVKEAIIRNKLLSYEQIYYGLEVEMEVTQDIDDKPGQEAVKKDMVKIKKIIKALETKMKIFETQSEVE